MTQRCICIIDDEEDLLFLLETRFKKDGYDVVTFESAEKFYDHAAELDAGAQIFVLSDYRLPEDSGVQLLERIQSQEQVVGFALQTGYNPTEVAAELCATSFPVEVLEKPVNMNELVEFVRKSFQQRAIDESSPEAS